MKRTAKKKVAKKKARPLTIQIHGDQDGVVAIHSDGRVLICVFSTEMISTDEEAAQDFCDDIVDKLTIPIPMNSSCVEVLEKFEILNGRVDSTSCRTWACRCGLQHALYEMSSFALYRLQKNPTKGLRILVDADAMLGYHRGARLAKGTRDLAVKAFKEWKD